MPEKYLIEFTPAEIDLVGKALGKLPLEEALTVWLSVKGQVIKQQQPADVSQPASSNTASQEHPSVYGETGSRPLLELN